MPWNFPIWQLTRMGIPTLLAGYVVLVKRSPNTQRSSLEFERVMHEAGFPEGVSQNLILKTEDIVNVINDPRVQGASVTGSVRAGSAVASEAVTSGTCPQWKPSQLKRTPLRLAPSRNFNPSGLIRVQARSGSPMGCEWPGQEPLRRPTFLP
jgi:acyl-CoA reductase-like NAD-dependent aldehyde dehydrogenase